MNTIEENKNKQDKRFIAFILFFCGWIVGLMSYLDISGHSYFAPFGLIPITIMLFFSVIYVRLTS